MVVNEIVKGVKTTEPLYKFTYIMPDIEFDDEDTDRIYSVSLTNIKSVIFNKTTYVENSLECVADCIESTIDDDDVRPIRKFRLLEIALSLCIVLIGCCIILPSSVV